MRAILAATTLALCLGTAQAQTFVPRFDRPDLARNTEPSAFGAKSDLETSMGRVAEAPRLMPKGASASMSSDDEPGSATSPSVFAIVAQILLATIAVLAVGTLSWRLHFRSKGQAGAL